jgi:hypothetical protein
VEKSLFNANFLVQSNYMVKHGMNKKEIDSNISWLTIVACRFGFFFALIKSLIDQIEIIERNVWLNCKKQTEPGVFIALQN